MGTQRRRFDALVHGLLLAMLLPWVGVVSLAAAAPPPVEAPPPTEEASATAKIEAQQRKRAEDIARFLAGELDLSIDPETFLRPDLARLEPWMLDPAALAAADAREAPRVDAPSVEELAALPASEALAQATLYLLRLDDSALEQLRARHSERQREHAEAVERAEQQARAAIAAANQAADQLEALMREELSVDVDPESFLRVDLRDPQEFALSTKRRESWTGRPAGDEPEFVRGELEAELVAARDRLDAARRRFLELSPEARAQLLQRHAERVTAAREEAERKAREALEAPTQAEEELDEAQLEASKAAAERQAAEEAARAAETATQRALAQARIDVLALQEAQALFDADIRAAAVRSEERADLVAGWQEKVSELETSAAFPEERAAIADPLYLELRETLATTRGELQAALAQLRAARGPVPGEKLIVDEAVGGRAPTPEILALRTEVAERVPELRKLRSETAWERAEVLRDEVVALNQIRLRLLALGSPTLRQNVTGFGDEGLDQVRRELAQISAELAFHTLTLPRYRDQLAALAQHGALALIFSALKLIALLIAFIVWRRRGDGVLTALREYLLRDPRAGGLRASLAVAVWYLERVRAPLEWLLLLWLSFRVVSELVQLPELDVAWLVALWVLLGLAVIDLVDAMAQRDAAYTASASDTAALRLRSLRIVGLSVVSVGLILSVTVAFVGRGAIYSWVISTCWVLSIPIVIYLVSRWREVIKSRLDAIPDPSGFVVWVRKSQTGLRGLFAGVLAAAYLLARGTGAWIMRQLGGLETTRRFLAYLFRREVAKQAATAQAEGQFEPISDELRAGFGPTQVPLDALREVAAEQLERISSTVLNSRPTLSAVVGERGSGKSLFLTALTQGVDPERSALVQCPESGWEGLQGELAQLAGVPEARGEALATALRALGPKLIAIDDAQRLVVPAVRGLAGLDAFTRLAREVEGEVSWVVGIGSACWQYVRRARADNVFFEQVVQLPRWSEEELAKLLTRRCAELGVTPNFDGLVVPRQGGAPLGEHTDRTQAGYYRLLWDYSAGNPAIALQAFRDSLFTARDGSLVVRLFQEPPTQAIEDLPMPVLFVLRSIVQLELAVPAELEAATRMAPSDVVDAVQFCLARNYLTKTGPGVRVSWAWYRPITTVLQRQHLLAPL